MELSKGVHMLHLPYHGMVIHPTLLIDQEMAVLVDTGFPGQIGELQTAIEQAGISFNQLKAVILTHQDLDHIGSLPEIWQKTGGSISVYAHEQDRPYIQGELPLVKDGHLDNPPKGKVTDLLVDGQELPFCGGIRVIYTPGHTEGHISLYLRESKTLIAGDSMYSVDGKLMGVHAPTTLDLKSAQLSLKKYAEFDITSVICYHGGVSTQNIQQQLRDL
ncbi:MBL fold metallo-hydrolase [Brevibacillus choshinensis]|uniref:MBL fold metallo-hydrolase n=1 Tax=Brevibacillus choshinensis TaxID=54911 RepID=UPI002E1A61F7|nr:MBL fold metallo-hydrolase [Brevibacillus choshinensis]MED4754320.1 MBL fold metallo-hydrolase [Brevibacillus choshinensis]MED4782521.1 MBL fold metallo-hydrolase [Brevibacillus choshinensis]